MNDDQVDVVIPLRAHSRQHAFSVITRLCSMRKFKNVRIIVTDNSHPDIQRWLDETCFGLDIVFIANQWPDREVNKKMLNLHKSLSYLRASKIIVLDDDSSLPEETLHQIAESLEGYDYVRTAVRFEILDLFNIIDLCGLFITNTTCADRQFWGIQAMSRKAIDALADVDKSTVFDELTVYRHLTRRAATSDYLNHAYIISHCNRSSSEFIGQRLRYAYENLAYPCRTAVFMSVYPLLFGSGLVDGLHGLGWVLTLVSMFAIVLSLIGWASTRRAHRHTITINAIAPIWLFIQAAFIWLAALLSLGKGVHFSQTRLRRPV